MYKNFFLILKIKSYFKNYINYINSDHSNNKILVELNNMSSSIIININLLKILLKNKISKVVIYKISSEINIFYRLFFLLRSIVKLDSIYLYSHIFKSEFIFFMNNNKNYDFIFKKIIKNIKTKRDVERIKIKNILVGDLIYDTYLRDKKKYTIDIYSDDFKIFLKKCIKIFIYWDEYFKNNNITSVIASHSVYLNAIPIRIAISKDIPAYITSLKSIYYLNKHEMFAYRQYNTYPKIFKKLTNKNKLILLAKKRLKFRLGGKIGVDMLYSTKSAWSLNFFSEKIIRKSNKIKILIVAHDFFDSPHSYGNNLFADFYEWLIFLRDISLNTDYDWYIKTHPDYTFGSRKIIENFVKNNKKFTLLPSSVSHNQIIKEQINFALTIYGSIGVEYAAKAIPVINGSINNPHFYYKFNLHPKNIENYKKILYNLKKIKLKINYKKVMEYYFMHNLYAQDNLLFGNSYELVSKVGGYKNLFNYKFYEYYLKNNTSHLQKNLTSSINSFITSKSYVSDIYLKNIDNKIKL
jgi:hypothetical protein